MTRKRTGIILLLALLLIGVGSYAQIQTPSPTPNAQEQVQTPSQMASAGDQTQTSSQTLASSTSTPNASAPSIVVFYEEGCPHCVTMEGLLDDLLVGHEADVVVARYEINAPGSSALLWKLAAHYGIVATQVPVIFIGDQAIIGAGRAQEFNLRTAVDDCVQLGCPSPLEYVEGGKAVLNDLLIVGAFIGVFIALLIFQGL
ncbi:glutaredoxin [Candidatus Bipolaricaulota bacterium]|nr:glutaredoxin [Candidatus Bipolaricaulota bacterium]